MSERAQSAIHDPPGLPRMRAYRVKTTTAPEALKTTIGLIGRAIEAGAEYVPIRQHAASLASRVGPKDFLGQFKQIYDDFTQQRWRYVFDPVRTELLAVTGPVIYGTVLGFDEKPPSRGYGDCDDATVALGALAESIGLLTRIVTIAKPESNQLFSHVFPQIRIPQVGWISADAVAYPARPLGWTPPHGRFAVWNTRGKLLAYKGRFPPSFKKAFTRMKKTPVRGLFGGLGEEGDIEMSFAGMSFEGFQDYGLENFGLAGTDNETPDDLSTDSVLGFGAYVDKPLPMVGADRLNLMMEYRDEDTIGMLPNGMPVVRTKILEMDPRELARVYRKGCPRLGAVALSDDGDVYQWTEVSGMGGFFKKLLKKAKKKVRKKIGQARAAISKKARKLIKKLPGGKYLVKVYDKVKSVAMKAVRPLVKILGKVGKKLAPIAALIPGYGPVVAAALYKAGHISKLLQNYGVVQDKKGRPKFKSGKQAKEFQRALKTQASRMRKRRAGGRVNPRMLKRGSSTHKSRLKGYGLQGV